MSAWLLLLTNVQWQQFTTISYKYNRLFVYNYKSKSNKWNYSNKGALCLHCLNSHLWWMLLHKLLLKWCNGNYCMFTMWDTVTLPLSKPLCTGRIMFRWTCTTDGTILNNSQRWRVWSACLQRLEMEKGKLVMAYHVVQCYNWSDRSVLYTNTTELSSILTRRAT